jgi:hypothetical protein
MTTMMTCEIAATLEEDEEEEEETERVEEADE